MNFSVKYKYMTLMAGAAMMLSAHDSLAQTVTVDTDVDVQNTLTLTVQKTLNFGKIIAVDNDATKVASVELDPVLGTLAAPATTGTPAVIAIVDTTNVSRALIDVEDGANGAPINITISNVVSPVLATKTFDLDLWETAYNAGASTSRTAGTTFTNAFDTTFNAGVNTLKIGATLKTTDVVYGDGNYDGGFDVTFSY
jgi:hypothetical protein